MAPVKEWDILGSKGTMLFLSPVSDFNVMADRCMFMGGNGGGLKGVKKSANLIQLHLLN